MVVLWIWLAQAMTIDGYQEHFLTYRNEKGFVDYQALQQDTAREEWLKELASATIPETEKGKKAFWLNAYNAITLDLIADNYPLNSIMDLDQGKVWKTRKFQVAGKEVTLDEIENQILRPMGDPKIHAAVNCASKGCPILFPQAFTEEKLDLQLYQAMRAWVGSNAYRWEGKQLLLNNIFIWYQVDFSATENVTDLPKKHEQYAGIISFILPYVSSEEQEKLVKGRYTIGVADYDWSLNKQ